MDKVQKLIEKWESKHFALLDEYSKGHANNEVMRMYRSRMKDILEFVSDLMKLPIDSLVVKTIYDRHKTIPCISRGTKVV